MKKLFLLPLIIILVVGFIFAGCGAPTPTSTPTPTPTPTSTPSPTPTTTPTSTLPTTTMKPITVTFNGAQFGANDLSGRTFKWFMSKVTERTNGLIKFNFVGSFGLTKPGEEITALQTGIADVGIASPLYFPVQLYINAGFSRAVPFDIDDLETMTKVFYKLYFEDPTTSKILSDEHAKQGLKLLTTTVSGTYVIESKTPITKLADLKGKKLAIIGSEARLLPPTGAIAVGMPVGDRPTAIQTGVVDGSVVPFTVGYGFKIYEFAPYMIETGWGAAAGDPISWNMAKFNAFPPDIQKIILDTAKETMLQHVVEYKAWYASALETRKKVGGKDPVEFSAADLAAWAEIVGEPVADWVKEAQSKGITGADTVVERFIALEKETGFKFPKEWKIR